MQTPNLIEIAVAPMKADAIKRAEDNTQQRIDHISQKLMEGVDVPPRGAARMPLCSCLMVAYARATRGPVGVFPQHIIKGRWRLRAVEALRLRPYKYMVYYMCIPDETMYVTKKGITVSAMKLWQRFVP